MLLSARRTAVLVPLLVLLVVGASHLGFRSEMYRTSRPEFRTAHYYNAADGCLLLYDGVPVAGDVDYARRLASLFRGAPASESGSINDERPLVPFLQALLGNGVLGAVWIGVLLNFLAVGLASACAVDLALGLGRGVVTAMIFGCLVAGTRGVGYYLGSPDGHMTACAWVTIAVWLHERLAIAEPATPRENAVVYGLVLGAALVTYLGDIGLLGFLWLYGLGRTPFFRLVGMSALALGVALGWRLAGRAAGLPFDSAATHYVGDGLRMIAALVGETLAARGPGRGAHLARLLEIATGGLVPGFGIPLLALGLAGLVFATARERRLALAVFLPTIVAAWPVNASFGIVNRLRYPAATGLYLAAAIALGVLARRVGLLARALGRSERTSAWSEVVTASLALVPVLVYESTTIFGRASLWIDE